MQADMQAHKETDKQTGADRYTGRQSRRHIATNRRCQRYTCRWVEEWNGGTQADSDRGNMKGRTEMPKAASTVDAGGECWRSEGGLKSLSFLIPGAKQKKTRTLRHYITR